MFADDSRLTKVITNEDDDDTFQGDLEEVYSWSKEKNMLFNVAKFEVYGKHKELRDNYNYLSPESENIIERKESLRDLGVVMNANATFIDHINKVCNSVNQKAGWVLRTFNSRDSQFMKSMWKQLIQGHIVYCSQLYQPI